MKMRNKKLVVGNWKMNPQNKEEVKDLVRNIKKTAEKLNKTDIVIAPPFVFIEDCNLKENPIVSLGAQTVSVFENGSHTGEVGAKMLHSCGVKYVIIGHSERRATGETDADVSVKIKNTIDHDMVPIVCVGEHVRDDSGSYMDFLKEQIRNSLHNIDKKQAKEIIIAYEPVWAIGAKEAMKPEQIHETSIFIKKVLSDLFGPELAIKSKVLYGGSVNAKNAFEIMTVGKVDGLLVGRESVSLSGFEDLLNVVDSISE
jgi:triosephosphate isomerase